jgi:hypothetical protein
VSANQRGGSVLSRSYSKCALAFIAGIERGSLSRFIPIDAETGWRFRNRDIDQLLRGPTAVKPSRPWPEDDA